MIENWGFTAAQEEMFCKLREGQTIHKTHTIRLALLKREEVLEMQAEGGRPIEDQDHFFHTIVHALRNKLRRKLVALDLQQHVIVGSVTLADRYGDGKIYYGLDVLPEHQNKKYGQEITKATIEYVSKDYRDMIDRLHLVVAVDNAPAIHIYEKAGFAITKTGMDTAPDGVMQAVHVMELLLPQD